MNLEIILVGIVVGIANFASRFGPLFFIQKNPRIKRGFYILVFN